MLTKNINFINFKIKKKIKINLKLKSLLKKITQLFNLLEVPTEIVTTKKI